MRPSNLTGAGSMESGHSVGHRQPVIVMGGDLPTMQSEAGSTGATDDDEIVALDPPAVPRPETRVIMSN